LTQLYVSGTAKLTYIPVTPGDYNRDDTVDAADYVVWRNRLGTTYTPADYDVWRENFGQAIGSGMAEYGHRDSGPGASADPLPIAVPEPATLTLLITACAAHYARRRSTDLQPRSAALNSPPQITQFATKMIKNRGRSFDHLRKNPRVFAFGPSSPGQCAKWAARGG
jgi:hypothetical protein